MVDERRKISEFKNFELATCQLGGRGRNENCYYFSSRD